MRFLAVAMTLLTMVFASTGAGAAPGESNGMSSVAPMNSAHRFTFVAIDNETPMPLEDFKGKTLLIVNTASQCGLTGQYKGLQEVYNSYKDQGLVVIGVPSNDFGAQEPGTLADIQDFTKSEYSVSFPMTAKYKVTGGEAHPFFQWAAEQKAGGFLFSKPRWNFHKYLIGPDGELIQSFGSYVEPQSEQLTQAIEKSLGS